MIIGETTPLVVNKHTSEIVSPGTAARFKVANDLGGIGSGTVTSVSIVTANGISGSVATATTTPAITLDASAAINAALASIVVDDGEVVTDDGEVVWDS